MVAVALGGLAMREPALAAALAVTVAILLAARAPMHRFVREVLSQSELRSILIFAAATLIVWPVIPDRYVGPFAAINPRALWQVVILILAISAAGYIAVRSLGARFGLPLAGLASGFISSAATIAAMGARAAEDPKLMRPAVAGAVLSTVATVVQLALSWRPPARPSCRRSLSRCYTQVSRLLPTARHLRFAPHLRSRMRTPVMATRSALVPHSF